MKKSIGLVMALLLLLTALFAVTATANGESASSQDGLNVTIMTDKEEYSYDDEIKVSFSIENTNYYIVEGLSAEVTLPEGLNLKTGELAVNDIAIEAEQTFNGSVTAALSEDLKPTAEPEETKAPQKDKNDEDSQSENTGLIVWIIILTVIIVILIAIIVILLIINNKKGTGAMCLLLCIVLLAGVAPLPGRAEETLTITTEKKFLLGEKEYTIKISVNYSEDTVSSMCTVNFDTDGAEAIDSQVIEKGMFIEMPNAPTKDDFFFVGWYFDEQYNDAVDFEQPIYRSCTIYSRWLDLNDDTDTDNDGLVDVLEEYLKTDKNNTDTDGDGLNDYIDYAVLHYNPLLKDSDNNGVLDGEEDFDKDSLDNKREIELGTDLTYDDSDNDGLHDNDEVNDSKTDPCKYDTDEDGLSDYDEFVLGLDPLSQKTDGSTLDSERLFKQSLSSENIDERLLANENNAIPSLTLTTSGNINDRIFIETNKSSDFSDSRAIVGDPIVVCGENIGEGTLGFDLKAESELCLICKYNEDGSTEYLETSYDTEANKIYSTIDCVGTYFVLNVKNLFDELGLVLPSFLSEPVLETSSLSYKKAKNDASTEIFDERTSKLTLNNVMAQADIVFIIDTTGSMEDEINNVKENVQFFVDSLKEKGVAAGLALIDYQDIEADGEDSTRVHKNGSSNWFYDMDLYKTAISSLELGYGGDTPECAVDALETARLLDMRASAGKIFILVTDADYKDDNRYGISSMNAEIELLKNSGVTCAVVSSSSDYYTYYDLFNETNGIWANINGDFYTELMFLADKIGTDIVGDGYWIYLEGPVPVPVRLDAMPDEGSSVDTDKDGLTDIEELDGITPTRIIDLDDLVYRISNGVLTDTNYGTISMYKYKSNPTCSDTDFDGIDDFEDVSRRDNTFKGVLSSSFSEGINVDFSVDYRDFIDNSNTQYSTDKSVLASIFATLAYGEIERDKESQTPILEDGFYKRKNSTIKITEGAQTEGSIKNMYDLIGLYDYAEYSMKDMPEKYNDDDISEFMIGHRLINYQGTNTEVFVVSVRGTNGTIEEWSSNFDVGSTDSVYWDNKNTEWKNYEHHKGFDITANRCYNLIMEYINSGISSGIISDTADKAIFITGHSRGAAIANLLGKIFEDDGSYISATYCFATPNVTTVESDVALSYKTIFNIINEDDLVTYLPLDMWGFRKYGLIKSDSVKKNYENKFGKAEKDTWEYLINANRSDALDYNYNGNLSSTIAAFKEVIASSEDLTSEEIRKKLYERSYNDSSYIILDKLYFNEQDANKAIEEIKTAYGFRLSRACDISIHNVEVLGFKVAYKVKVEQTPEFLLMTVADLAVERKENKRNSMLSVEYIFLGDLGYNVAPAFKEAKEQFIQSAVDSTSKKKDGVLGLGLVRFGGMTHGHWPETYYLLAKNI